MQGINADRLKNLSWNYPILVITTMTMACIGGASLTPIWKPESG